MKLKTRICDILGIEHPIVLGGMGGAGTPALVAAVSRAGGLGVLGAADCGGAELRANITEVRRLTDRPFGVNTLLPASVRREANSPSAEPPLEERLAKHRAFTMEFMQREGLHEATPQEHAELQGLGRPHRAGPLPFTQAFFDEQMEVIVAERVPVYASGLGSPEAWIERLHAKGTKVMALIGSPGQAKKLASSGLDVIIAQGGDAGGHNSGIGTLSLVPQVVDVVDGIPVLAAGGIADGRGVAAALMLGAEGAWIGSAFLATPEANLLDFQKLAIVEGSAEATTVSLGWTGKPARVLRSKWTDAWKNAELDPLPMPYQQMISWPVMAAALLAGRGDIAPGTAGQGIGLVNEIIPAGELVGNLVAGALEALKATKIK